MISQASYTKMLLGLAIFAMIEIGMLNVLLVIFMVILVIHTVLTWNLLDPSILFITASVFFLSVVQFFLLSILDEYVFSTNNRSAKRLLIFKNTWSRLNL